MTTTIQTSQTTIIGSMPNVGASSGDKLAADQLRLDDQSGTVGGTQSSRTAMIGSTTKRCSSSGDTLADSQQRRDRHTSVAVGTKLTTDHIARDAHGNGVGGVQPPRGRNFLDVHLRNVTGAQSTGSHAPPDTHSGSAVGSNFPPDQCGGDDQNITVGRKTTSGSQFSGDTQTTVAAGPTLRDPVLGVLADVLDDLESVRIANENRLRTLTSTDEHGHGLTLAHPEIARLAAIVDVLKDQEHQAQLNLCRVMRKHPLWEFAKPLKGVGEKQFARLIAVVGDPYWNDLHNRPRTVSELRSYCGFGDPEAQRRQRGQKANWNATARSRVWLIAESCMKQKESGQYRAVYDVVRERYADAVHDTECKRCGPAGKPAQPGSPLSLAHQHARGLRAIAKQLLKDIWLAAAQHHDEAAS